MGVKHINIRVSAAKSIAEISCYLESEALLATADKFKDAAYDFISKLGDQRKGYRICRDPERSKLGYKCMPYKKKYTIVFIELDNEIITCEFILSKFIHW